MNAQLEALRPDWATLWANTPTATPFQSPHWLLPWWHHFGTGQPLVAAKHQDGRLSGVLPLYILPNERKLLPIGAGSTDYIDVLGEGAGLLQAALAGAGPEIVDSCDLIEVLPDSSLIGQSCPGWQAQWQQATACPVLVQPGIPKLARRKLAMNRNRAERAGGWTIKNTAPATLQNDLEVLVGLHGARWRARGGSGMLADRSVVMFWREAAPGLLAAGLLRLETLLIGDEPAAIIAALLSPGRIFFYLSGFDEAFASISPGTVLLGAMLEQALAEGRTEAHFLRGRESYKYAWGAQDRFNWYGRLTPDR